MELKNKKVLLVGLGILGGGLSIAKYLLKNEAKLTISDLRDKKELMSTINKLNNKSNNKIKYILGRNPEKELDEADLIILNPAVSAYSPLVKKIKNIGKEYYNDYTFFLTRSSSPDSKSKAIGITGTRGKTTITTWIQHFIEGSIIGGNIPESGLFKIIDKKPKWFVLELSSFQLEHLRKNDPSPNIAILTNIYIDHLNRYKTMKRYSDVKKKIYQNQKPEDFLIISNDETITKEIEKDKPKSRLLFVSLKKLPPKKNGLFFIDEKLYQKDNDNINEVGKFSNLAPHEKYNFMFAALAANLAGVSWGKIFKKSRTLENPLFRQQIISIKNGLQIINDSAATSPEATIAAIEKYKKNNLYLITGGTDKELNSTYLAKKIANEIKQEKIFLLSGSATNNLINNLPTNYLKNGMVREFDTLEKIIKIASKEIKKGVLLFSPGAASFEKFKNEFDRGHQFNKLVKKYF